MILDIFRRDKREFPRLSVKLGLKYKLLNRGDAQLVPYTAAAAAAAVPGAQGAQSAQSAQETDTYSRNLSIGWVSVATGKEKIPPGSALELEISFPEGTEPVHAIGKVVWTRGNLLLKQNFSGVEFISMKVKDFDMLSAHLAGCFAARFGAPGAPEGPEGLKKIFIQFFSIKKKDSTRTP